MDNLDDKRLRVQITEQELLCKNRCGFYGTPQWNGLCSTCWRVYQLEVKRANDYNKNRSLLGNEKQEEKKIDGKGKIRSILSKSPSIMFSNAELTTSTTHSSSASPLTSRSRSPPENEAIQSPFQKYLYETFSSVVAKDIDKNCKHLIHRLFHGDNLSMDELSEIVQAFYQEMKDRLLRIKSLPKEFNMSHFMNELEKYICTEAYSALFFSRSDDEAADLSLQDRIRSLHWVTSGFLETALDFSIPKVQDFIDEAVTEIIDINSHQAVEDKLAKLVICSKKIFEALKESRSGAPASADEFLPGLIYIILKANPPLILSNLKFISRFALPSRVIRGESGYYFTNLSCALQFIQDMNAESLRMRKDEFEAYTTGKQMAPLVNRDCMSNLAIRSMENSLKQLQLLREDQMKIKHRMQELEKRINEDAEEFKLNVQRFLDSYPSEKVRQICQSLKDEPEEWRFLS